MGSKPLQAGGSWPLLSHQSINNYILFVFTMLGLALARKIIKELFPVKNEFRRILAVWVPSLPFPSIFLLFFLLHLLDAGSRKHSPTPISMFVPGHWQ